jgi:hypothetical protein
VDTAAVSIQMLNDRFRPGAGWRLARKSRLTEDSVQEGHLFTSPGVSYGESITATRPALANTKTGQVIKLGGSFNWAPVWSSVGNRVAYYSDGGGEAGPQ